MEIKNVTSTSFRAIRLPLEHGAQENLPFVMEFVENVHKLYKPMTRNVNNHETMFFDNFSSEDFIKTQMDKYGIKYMQSHAVDAYSHAAKEQWAKTGQLTKRNIVA